MHIVHELRLEEDKVYESVGIYKTAVSRETVEAFPRSYPITLLSDPVMSAMESFCIAEVRANQLDKVAVHTYYSNIPGAVEAYERSVRGE